MFLEMVQQQRDNIGVLWFLNLKCFRKFIEEAFSYMRKKSKQFAS